MFSKQRSAEREAFYSELDRVLSWSVFRHWSMTDIRNFKMTRGVGWSRYDISMPQCDWHVEIGVDSVVFMATTPMNPTKRELVWYTWDPEDDHNDVVQAFGSNLEKIWAKLAAKPKMIRMLGLAWPFKAYSAATSVQSVDSEAFEAALDASESDFPDGAGEDMPEMEYAVQEAPEGSDVVSDDVVSEPVFGDGVSEAVDAAQSDFPDGVTEDASGTEDDAQGLSEPSESASGDAGPEKKKKKRRKRRG